MLFVAEYSFAWDAIASVAAKRLEWDGARPEGFRFVGEWLWKDDPAFRGVAVVDVDDVAALHAFALHYGPTLTVTFRPATDVMSALSRFGASAEAGETRNARLRSRRPRSRRGA